MERFIGGKLPASSAHGATDVCLGVLFEDARGEVPSLGSWNPSSGAKMTRMDDGLWVLMEHPPGVGAGTQFKYVLMSGSKPPRWEGRANRNWREAEAPVATHLFDSTQNERPKKPAHLKKKLSFVPERLDQFIERVADENQERVSYRLKLELPRILLEEDLLNSLSELACLQAYLTFVASGQISCKEDGGHHRPCAAANAAKAVTEALWDISTQGDAELFIARRIFPSLPSFSDEFTCAVPMTRIRDIAHRGDIPHDMKQYIKHNLQNKLHRCADPGDLIKLDQLVERVDREGGYSQAFVRELKIFQVELRDFFNATGLDDSARQIAAQDGSVKDQVDMLLHLKNSGADAFGQMEALTALRRKVAPKVVAEQNWLRLDIELEKYAFVLLSQVANQLEHDSRGSQPWWDRLLKSFSSALQQTELSGLSVEECRCVQSEIAATETSQLNQRGSMAPLRLVASMDRTLRICFKLTAALEAAYAGVPALGRALHIDAHAVAVFVEAELRASVLFQVSKLAQLAMQQAKVAAGLPLWTAISAGTACGRCMMLPSLAAAWQQQLPEEGCVLFCNEASGDEEVPKLVRGVVVARDLPVLSHLALRARQLGVVFACTAEGQLYEKLKAQVKERQPLQLTVDAAGDCRAAVASEAQLKAAASGAGGTAGSGSAKPKLGECLGGRGETVALADQPQVAGSKAASSGKLEKLSAQLGFKAPKGMAIPFGVMKSSVSGGDFQSALKRLETALSKGTEVEVAAAQVREAVEKMTVPKEVLSDLAKGFPAAARVAVRSSANSEDLEKVSGAGLHDSVLGVDLKDPAKLQAAILQVWGSMFTLRAVQSRHAAGMPLYDGIAMGVLVQPMVSLSGHCYAFIAFSKDAVAQNDDAVYIEMCIGLGETLASANEPGTPYRLTVQKREPMEVKIASLGSFSRGLEDLPDGLQHVRVDYSKEQLSTNRDYLTSMARDIAKVAVGIEQGYGTGMDMEGVVLESGGRREIHLVQARPIVGP
ncbi:Phosphoglucan [Durusdinium trenchii]|uniref:Chloroplastic n=1 Tax=Durusdinium trenchii TaxID=1381693 RepID=A0ABP0KYF0_9DINO